VAEEGVQGTVVRTDQDARTSLVAMLEARSVAVVGASSRPESFGEQMMVELAKGRFGGRIYPVNPKYDELFGHRCFPDLASLPEPVDLAILGVPNGALEGHLIAAAEAGARSAVIFASCHEPPSPDRPPLEERLTRIATEGGMALCGGNGMGFFNLAHGLRACGFTEPEDVGPGPITFLSHSGSLFSALLHNRRGLRFNLVVSTGLELVTTMDEYLDYALDQPLTKVVALFLETVRRPAAFRAALAKAEARDVPIVALKVGRTRQSSDMVAAHSGALAGEDGAYEALFDAHGVIRVDSMNEMLDTLELLAAGRKAGPGALAAIHDSGGERAHLIDVAERAGVPFTEIGDETKARISAVLEPGLEPTNPLDAWGTGNEADAIFVECMRALLDDPGTAALAFSIDLTTELVPEHGYTLVAREVFRQTTKPVAVLSNVTAAIDPRDAGLVRATGIPVLEGTETGLLAFRHLFDHRDALARPPVERAEAVPAEVRDRWLARLGAGEPFDDVEALALLADYGVPTVRTERAASLKESLAAVDRLGWPVALKTRAGAHKSDIGGVALNLTGPEALAAAYDRLAERLGPDVTVSAMAQPGVELGLGVVRDAQFGPMVMVAAGGVLIEVLGDRRFALPPIDEPRATAMVDRLAGRTLLDGVRGSPAADLAPIARALVRLSVLAEDLGDHLDALDVNPLICGPNGCVAVDALVIPRKAAT
jgi:acyl-CoA synthetase (NDP forming)